MIYLQDIEPTEHKMVLLLDEGILLEILVDLGDSASLIVLEVDLMMTLFSATAQGVHIHFSQLKSFVLCNP